MLLACRLLPSSPPFCPPSRFAPCSNLQTMCWCGWLLALSPRPFGLWASGAPAQLALSEQHHSLLATQS